ATDESMGRESCRAQARLWLDEGEAPEQIAGALRVSRRTVDDRLERFHRLDELDLVPRLDDAPRPGRPREGGGDIDPRIADVSIPTRVSSALTKRSDRPSARPIPAGSSRGRGLAHIIDLN